MKQDPLVIIIAGDVDPSCEAILAAAGYRNVRRTRDLRDIKNLCAQRPADVIIFGGSPAADLSFLGAIRGADTEKERYTSMLLCMDGPGAASRLPEALAQGVDDYVTTPLDAATLAARVATAARIASLETRLIRPQPANAWAVSANDNMVDALTGLGTRHYLIQHLGALLQETKARGGITCCVTAEIDHFTALQQRHGQDVSEEILVGIAKRLKKALRPTDFIARIRNGEFAVALRYTTGTGARSWIFERILRTISYPPFNTSTGEIEITASVGVSCEQGDCTHCAEEMLASSAERMREARDMGGNTLVM